jgi:hypothetical protein
MLEQLTQLAQQFGVESVVKNGARKRTKTPTTF